MDFSMKDKDLPVEFPIKIKDEIKTESELILTDDESMNSDLDEFEAFPVEDKSSVIEIQSESVNLGVINDLKNVLKILKDKSRKKQGRKANGRRYNNNQRGNYKCDECDKSFRFYATFQAHKCCILFGDTQSLLSKSKECLKTFADKYKLKEKKKINSPVKLKKSKKLEKLKCTFCSDYCATRKQYLANHIARFHTGCENKHFMCHFCKKSFVSQRNCKDHERFVHTYDGKQFTCDICKKQFKKKTDLVYHIKMHIGMRDYVCEICKKAFRMKSKLVRHERSQQHKYRLSLGNTR